MAEDAVTLFEEYAARVARGERPDVREYLERAGDERPDLARLLDRLIAGQPAREPEPETVELVRSWLHGEPTLLELRRRRRLRREDVVSALVERLRLDPAKREKVAGYYHELESGLLDRRRVGRGVFEALAEILMVPPRDLLAWPGRPLASPAAFFRVDADAAPLEEPPAAPQRGQGGWDEIDELFQGGP